MDAAIMLAKMAQRVGPSGFYQPSPVSSPVHNNRPEAAHILHRGFGSSAGLMQEEQRSPFVRSLFSDTPTCDVHGSQVHYKLLGVIKVNQNP